MPLPPPPPPPGPAYLSAPTNRRAAWALAAAITGIGIGLLGLLAGVAVLLFAGGNLSGTFAVDAPELNAFGIGIPALALGPLAYFLGKASGSGGSAAARSSVILGIVATVLGAAAALLWLVITLLGYFGPPPA